MKHWIFKKLFRKEIEELKGIKKYGESRVKLFLDETIKIYSNKEILIIQNRLISEILKKLGVR